MAHHDAATAKRLMDNLQTDLRTLSSESKRKYPNVKEAAEQVQLRLRSISAKNTDIITGLVSASVEVVQPFVLGCDTKQLKIVQLCLMSVQRIISHEALSMTAANSVIQMLWQLMEVGIEELKLLQTAILLITTNSVVQHESLAKALVLCFRLHFTKDSTTTNTAAAIIKQLVNNVFERVVLEDRVQSQEKLADLNLEELKAGSRTAPHSLRPCAGDAYLLFQDLCQLVNADQPFWMTGMTEMTRTFGLELLEAVLSAFPSIFQQHQEFSFLLKERVCPLVIKLFSPSLKYKQGLPMPPAPAPAEKPYFPVVMRLLRIVSALIRNYFKLLVTECEIFLALLVKFLEPEKPMWQRCISLEVLHKLSTQPNLIKSFCQCYDMKQHSTKIFRDIVNGIGAFIQSQFMNPLTGPSATAANKNPDIQGSPPALVGGLPVGGGVTPQPAFMYRGVWIPFVLVIPSGQTRPMYLEMLDKVEPPPIADGFGLSISFYCLTEIVKSVQFLLEGETDPNEDKSQDPRKVNHKDMSEEERGLNEELINSSWCGMLAALSLLLDASTDESATERVLKSLQIFANLCGLMKMNTPRDAFITALCKASLPPHYTLTILHAGPNTGQPLPRVGHYRSTSQDLSQTPATEAVERSQVVAVGTPLPTASLPAGAHQGPVMLTAKNIQCMRSLLSVAHCHGGILGTAWHLVLTTLQHLVWILGLKPSSGGSLRASQQLAEGSNAVITTAVMADLPVLSAMLSRLFESSQYLDDVALHHLIDALCKLSSEAMELAYSNREPSLFAVAKLLETGLVNLSRVEVLWRPVTAHLLEAGKTIARSQAKSSGQEVRTKDHNPGQEDRSQDQNQGQETRSKDQNQTKRPEAKTRIKTKRPERKTRTQAKQSKAKTKTHAKRPETKTRTNVKRPAAKTRTKAKRPETKTRTKANRPEAKTRTKANRPEAKIRNKAKRPETKTRTKANRPETKTRTKAKGPETKTRTKANRPKAKTRTKAKRPETKTRTKERGQKQRLGPRQIGQKQRLEPRQRGQKQRLEPRKEARSKD